MSKNNIRKEIVDKFFSSPLPQFEEWLKNSYSPKTLLDAFISFELQTDTSGINLVEILVKWVRISCYSFFTYMNY